MMYEYTWASTAQSLDVEGVTRLSHLGAQGWRVVPGICLKGTERTGRGNMFDVELLMEREIRPTL